MDRLQTSRCIHPYMYHNIHHRCRKGWKHAEKSEHFFYYMANSPILLYPWTAWPHPLINVRQTWCARAMILMDISFLLSFFDLPLSLHDYWGSLDLQHHRVATQPTPCHNHPFFLEGVIHICYPCFFISHIHIQCLWWEISHSTLYTHEWETDGGL